MERDLLQQISALHGEYQTQIDQLLKTKLEVEEKYGRENVFGKTCVVNLRMLRKRIKKLEYAGRRMGECNATLKK
jgi:hypothetical protein